MNPPTIDSIALLNQVIAERQNGSNAAFFNGIALEWRDRVQSYLDSHGSPEVVAQWPAIEDDKDKLINLYKNRTKGSAQGTAIRDLRQHSLQICPACGEFGRPNTLDHYLPKGIYPHFAVVPHNLFPMCDACQGIKLEKVGDGDTARFFIHPYYDRFTCSQLATLSIVAPFETPTFTLVPNPELDVAERALVATHLKELGIAERYIDFFKEEYRRLLRLVHLMRSNGQDCEATLSFFRFNAHDVSPSSWQHVFYDGVLSNSELIGYLTYSDLPPYL
ncbi:hypothetical protein [Neorhizobium sp. DAR64872/K0K18]|uniref:hypothetical protein n=1 Tax=Neorhizobium sp. DAR64872/K0K18 TaxID=3421958 RepID=UPI003D2AFBA8